MQFRHPDGTCSIPFTGTYLLSINILNMVYSFLILAWGGGVSLRVWRGVSHTQGMEGGHPQGMEGGHPQGMEGGHPQGMEGGHTQGKEGGHTQGMEGGHP